ncbi:MAG: hypothetical protein K8R99_11225 [Actinomycetia bacterium]|nr:hypothetical protein [Actinomycetes bacterium]
MRTLRSLAIIPVAALLLGACDDSSDKSSDTTVPAPATVQIDVTIGVDSGPDRIETVAVGTEVTLTVTSPDADDEVHVHTIDVEKEVAAGETASFTFVVDTVGEIEVESHTTEEVLVVIDVV